MLKKGLSCRVGNGASITILEDPWLPDNDNPFIQTNQIGLRDKTISSLMVTGENRWDVDLLNDMFEERDIDLILSIPLRDNDSDSWYWKKEKLRCYSVKTAYKLLQESKLPSPSNNNPRF